MSSDIKPNEKPDSECLFIGKNFRTSAHIDKISPAFVAAQKKLKPVLKDKHVDMTLKSGRRVKYSYADFDSVSEEVKSAYNSEGIGVLQTETETDIGILVGTMLLHSSGQWFYAETHMNKGTAQDAASGFTYGKRYSLSGMAGLSTEADDDGSAASDGKSPDNEKSNLDPFTKKQFVPTGSKLQGGDYVIKFGKLDKKKVKDIPDEDLTNYASYLHRSAKESGKPLSPLAKEFLDNAEYYLTNKTEQPPPIDDYPEYLE